MEGLEIIENSYNSLQHFKSTITADSFSKINSLCINLKNYDIVSISYDEFDDKTISELNDRYYEYYNMYINASTKNDMENYEAYKELFDRTCIKLNSINYAIETYEKDYGNQLVADIAAKVLTSKVVDTDGEIIPSSVSNIQGEFTEDGKMVVSFTYDDFGNTVKVVSEPFQNQGYDLVENLAKDIANNNNLKAIHETKVLANDNNYVIFATKEIGFKSR